MTIDSLSMSFDSPAAVLWDMDGTIIDSEPFWLEAELAMLKRYDIAMTPEIRDRLVGAGLWDAAELFRQLGVSLTPDEIVTEWVKAVDHQMQTTAPTWRPGARELLASLRQHKIPCALVTMSVRSLADVVIAKLPPDTFSAIVTGEVVAYEKPHPEPYLLGAAALGVAIEECVAFEDSPPGVHSASSAGAVTVGVPNLLPLNETPAHKLLATLEGVTADTVCSLFSQYRGTTPRASHTNSDRDVIE